MLRQRLRQRPPRLKGLSISKLLPNILTLLALCAGLTAVRYGLQEQWKPAVLAIFVAGVLDGLDGRLARLLGGTSRFGAELDSLSDFVSFGVAPALLLYIWTMDQLGGFGWALVLLFAVCMALRLARFNTRLGDTDLPAWGVNYFTGVPAPAAAGLVLMPMMMTFEVGPAVFARPEINAVFMVAISMLMVSRVPTFSFKAIKIPHQYVLPTLVLVGLIAAAAASLPWLTLTLLGVAYLATIPFSIRSFRILEREAKRLQSLMEEDTERRPARLEVRAGLEKPRRIFRP
jgi:CDP-diacylglycerol--serine O-phosphatidyltransferase